MHHQMSVGRALTGARPTADYDDAFRQALRDQASEKAIAEAAAKVVKLPRPETTVPACPRIKASKIWKMLPVHYIEALEHNQKIPSCCRHPENHDIEAHKSHPDERAPDIYVFICTCGRKHTRFCVGGGDIRPYWG